MARPGLVEPLLLAVRFLQRPAEVVELPSKRRLLVSGSDARRALQAPLRQRPEPSSAGVKSCPSRSPRQPDL